MAQRRLSLMNDSRPGTEKLDLELGLDSELYSKPDTDFRLDYRHETETELVLGLKSELEFKSDTDIALEELIILQRALLSGMYDTDPEDISVSSSQTYDRIRLDEPVFWREFDGWNGDQLSG
jgi:hypothetical protein